MACCCCRTGAMPSWPVHCWPGMAERSIDTQYYMWHQDTVGRLLLKELIDAADRGVQGAAAGRRHVRQRRAGHVGGDGCPPADRGAAVQPVLPYPAQAAAVRDAVQGHQLPHAQQDVYRGRSGYHRRRAQHRRRVFRGGSGLVIRRHGRPGGWSGRAGSVGGVRSILEQRARLPGGHAACRTGTDADLKGLRDKAGDFFKKSSTTSYLQAVDDSKLANALTQPARSSSTGDRARSSTTRRRRKTTMRTGRKNC